MLCDAILGYIDVHEKSIADVEEFLVEDDEAKMQQKHEQMRKHLESLTPPDQPLHSMAGDLALSKSRINKLHLSLHRCPVFVRSAVWA